MDKERKDHFWKAAVVVLIIFLFVQSGIMIYMFNNKTDSSEMVKVQDDAVIVPRGYQMPVQRNISSVSVPVQSNANIQTPLKSSGTAGSCAPCSKNASPAVKNILPPLPNMNSCPGSSCGSQAVTSVLPQSMNGGNCSVSVSSSSMPSGISSGMMQAMMNDPFFDDDSFFGDIHEEFARMQKLMDAMFSNSGMGAVSMTMPSGGLHSMSLSSSGIKDDGKNYIVELKVPGLDKSELKAKINGNVLTVSGVKKEEVQNNSQYGSSYSTSYSSFQNSFTLPGQVDSKNVTMDYKNGILKVILPKV
jgi:HSP20 family molecular chaperone IbpA